LGGDIDFRKLTRRYFFVVRGTPITWNNKKNNFMALSFTKFKFKTFIEVAKEG
jgi:hypothetical protein